MRLSEARIRKLTKKIAREMITRRAVKSPLGADALADAISRTMMKDQKMEEEIEAQAREMISRQRNLPPPGSGEYQAAFQQMKRAIAIRRGFPL